MLSKNRGQINNNKTGILINLGENKFETKMTATVLAFKNNPNDPMVQRNAIDQDILPSTGQENNIAQPKTNK